ncbi:MAG: DMT family transporter [Burkholderiales bacterium]
MSAGGAGAARGDARARVLAGIGLAVAASVSFALLDATVKVLIEQGYPAPMVAWARYAFHVLVMAVLLVPQRGGSLLTTRRPGLQVIRGACLGLSSITFFGALAVLPQAEATALIATSPILVTVVAVKWMKERAPRGTWLALAASFAGVLLIIRPGSALFGPAAVLPLLAAVFATGYTLSTRRLAGVDDGVSTLFIGGLVATLLLSGLVPLFWIAPMAWWHVALAVLAGLIGAGGHLLLVRAYERANASTLAPYTYAHTVAALFTGWLVFGTFPDRPALLGMALIVATGVAMAIARR